MCLHDSVPSYCGILFLLFICLVLCWLAHVSGFFLHFCGLLVSYSAGISAGCFYTDFWSCRVLVLSHGYGWFGCFVISFVGLMAYLFDHSFAWLFDWLLLFGMNWLLCLRGLLGSMLVGVDLFVCLFLCSLIYWLGYLFIPLFCFFLGLFDSLWDSFLLNVLAF